MFVTGLGCCASATVVVSSANSQQGGHDHPMVEGADTKGALHIGPGSASGARIRWL